MMSQRFSLFYAGFTAYLPALYFNQLEFIDSCQSLEDDQVKKHISEFSGQLQNQVDENTSHIKTAISIANHIEIDVSPQPDTYQDYFLWLNTYIENIEKEYPMGRIDHYYFLYARKIAEILCNIGLVKTYVDISLAVDLQLDLSKKIEKCLKDTEYILFKLMAAAALLSSEPRQNHFNLFYRAISHEFQQFKGVDPFNLNKQQLIKLRADLEKYNVVVMDGFKKCIGLLKELGI